VRFKLAATFELIKEAALEEQTEILREMRDLLRVLAEPALAARDKTRRAALIEIVGTSKKRVAVIVAMDGKKSQADLAKTAGINSSNVSRLVGELREHQLIKGDDRYPELTISIPDDFFDVETK